MTELTFAESAALIVRRTAQFGLTESQKSNEKFEKWFYVWIGDVVGELGEFITSQEDVEAGDVIWGITALCLLLELDLGAILTGCPSAEHISELDILLKSLELLEHGKKVNRDGIEARPIDCQKVTEILTLIYQWIWCNVESSTDEALALVDRKLRLRYPDGYSPEASVNRPEEEINVN